MNRAKAEQGVRIHLNIDHSGLAALQGVAHDVLDVPDAIDPVAFRAEQLCNLVVRRVWHVRADVAAAEKITLIGLFGAPATVVKNETDSFNPVADCRADFAHGHAETAVAHQADHRAGGATDFHSEAARIRKTNQAKIEW
jgi:hypothetical protein